MKNHTYYRMVEELLSRSIAQGTLPPGTQLMASPLAERLSVSRSPVTRALKALADRGVILEVPGQGYMVAGPGADRPVRRNLHDIDLTLGPDPDGRQAPVAPSWEPILDEVAAQVLNAIPFGTFMVSETVLGAHFGVSRTVVRDVLSRLHGQRMVRKDRQSHWITGPLSARRLADAHELRRQIEPLAVSCAIGQVPRADLAAMRERLRAALAGPAPLTQPQIDAFEADLHDTCVAAAPNRLLADTVRPLQLAHVVNRLFATYIGVHDAGAMLAEHRLVFDHMLIGDAGGAAAALRFHLDAEHDRARARLKVLSIFDAPEVAAYLSRIH
ncbi:GntR family transcriptional regulator [Rhodobaculum claviforme]|uniref:GntR family transcriptional regulator n=1 Tax=Rhodobaculum claviforme TaxID=1549854 RepID=UPI001912EB91